jgi:four helix bundle protein
MTSINRFEDVKAWQRARELAQQVYSVSGKGAFRRDYGLKDQIRRAAGSVMHNIAEGFDSGSDKEFIRFLVYARRSATEVQSQLYLALDQTYITESEFKRLTHLAEECKKTINGFIRYLEHSA